MSSSRIASSREGSSVSAVVLTIGEPTTDRAIESINRQSLPVSEIIVVRDEVPFHKALNQGAAQVRTPFFVQVDADMVLDPDCVESLLACAHDNVGEVAGFLRDPLLGRACCVKLYRTECFDQDALRNTVSPDTDFERELAARGFAMIYAIRPDHDEPDIRHTFGRHDPDYTIEYTFRKHLIEGRRYVYRKNFSSFKWHLGQLENQQSEVALAAQVAVTHGLFLEGREDQLVPYGDSEDQTIFELFKRRFERADTNVARLVLPLFTFILSGKENFERHYRLGVAMARWGSPAQMRRWILGLAGKNDVSRIVAKIAFCHGLFQPRYADDEARQKRELIVKFSGGDWPNQSWPERLKFRFTDAKAALMLFFNQI